MLATFVLSYFMWRYAETPFRDRMRTKTKTVALVSSIGFIALVTIGIVGHQTAFGKTSNAELAMLESQARIPTEKNNCQEVDFDPPDQWMHHRLKSTSWRYGRNRFARRLTRRCIKRLALRRTRETQHKWNEFC